MPRLRLKTRKKLHSDVCSTFIPRNGRRIRNSQGRSGTKLSRSTRLRVSLVFLRRKKAPRSYHSPVTPLHNTKLYREKGNYREVTDHSFPWGNFRQRRAVVSRDYYTPWSALWSFERYYRRFSMAVRDNKWRLTILWDPDRR